MKVLKTIIIGIMFVYLQTLVSYQLSIAEAMPCLILPFLVYLSITHEMKTSITVSFFMGLLVDITYPSLLGLSIIDFVLISFLVNTYHKSINKEKVFPVFLSLLSVNLIHFFIYTLLNLLIAGAGTSPILFLSVSLLYNTVLTVLLTYLLVILNQLKIVIDAT